MGTQVAEAFVKIRPDTKAFGAELKSGVSGDIASLAKTFAGLAIGAAVLKSWRDGINELKNAAAVSAQTANAIRATGGAANVSAGQVGELAAQLSEMSGVDDELIQSGSNLILTFKNVANAGTGVNAVFDRATTAALDLSTAGFGSMESASIMLGKALNDPIAGLTALQRAGVTFTVAQKATITSLVETGQTLEAQKVILAEVESQVGGSAKAFGETLPGQLAKAQVAMDETKAAMLAGLAPALELGAKAAGSFAGWIQGLPGPLRTIAALAITTAAGFVALARPINEVITLIGRMRTGTAAATAITTANTAAQRANTLAVGTNVGTLWAQNAATNAATAATGRLAVAGKALRAAFLPFVAVLAAVAAAYYGFKNAVTVSVDANKLAQTSTDDLVASYRKYMTTTGEMGELNRRVYSELAKESVGTVQRLRDALAAAGEDTSGLDDILRGYEQAQSDANAAMGIGAELAGDLGDGLDRTSEAADAAAGAVDFASDAIDRFNQAVGDAFGAVTSAAEAMLNHSAANRDMVESMRAANEVAADQKHTVDELAEAHEDALQGVIDFGEQTAATYEANGASAQDARRMQIAALKAVADNPEFAAIREQIQSLIAKYEAVPPEIDTLVTADTWMANHNIDETAIKADNLDGRIMALTATANTGAAQAALDRLLSSIWSVINASSLIGGGFTASSNSGGSAIAAASGYQGWVTGPQAFVVGENREPEYVSITPKSKMAASYPNAWGHIGGSGSGTSGGATTTINVTVVGGANPEDTGRRIGSSAAEVLARRGLAVAARTG